MSWTALFVLMMFGFALSFGSVVLAWAQGAPSERHDGYQKAVSGIGGAGFAGIFVLAFLLFVGVAGHAALAQYVAFAIGICITLAILWGESFQPANERNYALGFKAAAIWFVIGCVHLLLGLMMMAFGWDFGMIDLLFLEIVAVICFATFRSLVLAGQGTDGQGEGTHSH